MCYRRVDDKIEVLDNEDCPGEQPESEKTCMIAPCEGVDWIFSEWSQVSLPTRVVSDLIHQCRLIGSDLTSESQINEHVILKSVDLAHQCAVEDTLKTHQCRKYFQI